MPAYQPVLDKLLELCTDVRSSCTEDGIPDDDDDFFVSFYLQYVPPLKELLEKFVLAAAHGRSPQPPTTGGAQGSQASDRA